LAESTPEELESKRLELETSLNRMTAEADEEVEQDVRRA